MPNHIINILTIGGSDELVALIKSEILGFTKEEEGVEMPIDFNKIAPLPSDLEGTTSPPRIISQEEYEKQEARIAAGDLEEHEKQFGISRGITQDIHDELVLKYGYADWYGWQINAWGTKWNAYRQEARDNGDIKFETAWNTPYKLMVILSTKYPEATFKMRYSDEDFGHNVGEYTLQAGEVIDENIPEGGSEDAYMMACDIRDEWDYITGRIEELEEDDLENDWAQMFLKVAYKKALFGDYQKFIWDRLQQMSVDEENYELAQKIKEHLEQEQTV